MASGNIKYILTDIEGTTTSITFVYDVLFPFFRQNIQQLKELQNIPEVQEAFQQTKEIAFENEGISLTSYDQIIGKLLEWSNQDKKVTPLKTLQGIIWEQGYKSGAIKGHVYSDVAENLARWNKKGIKLGIFSSGSVAAQKLLFGYSEKGDLTPCFDFYFDTKTGGKRENETYLKISEAINTEPSSILFLSDIREELEAADQVGFQTMQLVREGIENNWELNAIDFNEISKKLGIVE